MTDARQPFHIACIGEALVELSDLDGVDGRVRLDFAGDTLNAAIYLARLMPADAGRVEYVTRLGPDKLSERMLERIAAEGIGTGLIGRDPDRLPGIYAIETEAGERRFRYWRAQSAARTLFGGGRPDIGDLAGFDVLWVSGITLAILHAAARDALIDACAECRARGGRVVFDSNYRARLWEDAATARAVMARMWRQTTLGLPSADDEAELWDEASEATLRRLSQEGVPEIVLKRGAEGPRIWRDGEVAAGPFPPAERVIDTTAAGDSFGAGYLAARLAGEEPGAAARAGHALARRVVAHRGAILPRDGG